MTYTQTNHSYAKNPKILIPTSITLNVPALVPTLTTRYLWSDNHQAILRIENFALPVLLIVGLITGVAGIFFELKSGAKKSRLKWVILILVGVLSILSALYLIDIFVINFITHSNISGA